MGGGVAAALMWCQVSALEWAGGVRLRLVLSVVTSLGEQAGWLHEESL